MRSRLSLSETGEIPFAARGNKWRRVNSTGRECCFMQRVHEDNGYPFSANNKVPHPRFVCLMVGTQDNLRSALCTLFIHLTHPQHRPFVHHSFYNPLNG